MWETKGKKTVRLVDTKNGITTAWSTKGHMECLSDWKRQYKKLKKVVKA